VLLALDESQGEAPERRVVADQVGTSESTVAVLDLSETGLLTAQATASRVTPPRGYQSPRDAQNISGSLGPRVAIAVGGSVRPEADV
jgi:hypothetical protein